jgi:hypothetical protein
MAVHGNVLAPEANENPWPHAQSVSAVDFVLTVKELAGQSVHAVALANTCRMAGL